MISELDLEAMMKDIERREEDMAATYRSAAARSSRPEIRAVFEKLAADEEAHRTLAERILALLRAE